MIKRSEASGNRPWEVRKTGELLGKIELGFKWIFAGRGGGRRGRRGRGGAGRSDGVRVGVWRRRRKERKAGNPEEAAAAAAAFSLLPQAANRPPRPHRSLGHHWRRPFLFGFSKRPPKRRASSAALVAEEALLAVEAGVWEAPLQAAAWDPGFRV